MKHPPTTQLISWLMDRDPELRVQACQGLGLRRIPTTGALVLGALTDKEPAVREAAALACGAIRGPGARRALERMASDAEPAVVAAAAHGLRALDREWPEDRQPAPPRSEPLEVLLQQAHDPDPRVRAEALGMLGGSPAGAALLLAALEDPFPMVRARAALVLGSHPVGRAREKLLDLLEDEEPEVREGAATALGRLRVGEAYPGLTMALGDDFQGVREAAAAALARIGGERICMELHHAARTWIPGSPPVLEALISLDEEVFEELLQWLEHPYEGVRGVAVDWITAHPDRRFLQQLEVLLDDPEPWLQDEVRSAVRIVEEGYR